VARLATMPEQYTKEKFAEKLNGFGTLTFTSDINPTKTCEQIYQAYKEHNEIETIFDAYKNFLKADLTYI